MIQVNTYFNGAVTSLALKNSDGKATVGVMEPGTYEFGTNTKEHMRIVSGILEVKLPNTQTWEKYYSGDSFEVASCSKFEVRCTHDVAYLCIYE